MKRLTMCLSALAMMWGPTLAVAADSMSGQPTPAPTAPGVAPSQAPAAAATEASPTAAAQTPPADWTRLSGTVQSVDSQAKTLQIKDETGSVLQVPIDREVSIQKDGKKVKLTQVQSGDTVILAKKPGATSEGSKTY